LIAKEKGIGEITLLEGFLFHTGFLLSQRANAQFTNDTD